MAGAEWFIHWRKTRHPLLQFFCFPYAGASASLGIFREWTTSLPDCVDVAVVELPGRGRRYGEPLMPSLDSVVNELAGAFTTQIKSPYICFGHSIGALIAFELMRKLDSINHRLADLLIVSAKRAPQLPHNHRLHLLPDPELVEALKDYNGTPADVLENSELMQLFLPILRADFSLAETYEHISAPPLDVPIHAFGGLEDPGVSEACLIDWSVHTSMKFGLDMFDGDHFFIHEEGRESVRERVVSLVEQWCSEHSSDAEKN
jgi:medium-chain acyl-[acyl-carrier-protein] hydrolase